MVFCQNCGDMSFNELRHKIEKRIEDCDSNINRMKEDKQQAREEGDSDLTLSYYSGKISGEMQLREELETLLTNGD